MNKLRITIIAIMAIIALSNSPCSAQCKEFNDTEAMPLLYDNENDEQFMLSGRYNTVKLCEGDDMLVFKSLTKGLRYRFIVKGDKTLPQDINMVIESWDGETIYDNKDFNYQSAWSYDNKKTQRVKIYIKVPKTDNGSTTSGCLSFITGLISNE